MSTKVSDKALRKVLREYPLPRGANRQLCWGALLGLMEDSGREWPLTDTETDWVVSTFDGLREKFRQQRDK